MAYDDNKSVRDAGVGGSNPLTPTIKLLIYNEVEIAVKNDWRITGAIDSIRVARFWSKVNVSDDNDACWEWKAYIGKNGYGQFKIKCTALGAHVVAYILTKGEVPPNKQVCHSCDNPRCCNPYHLWLGSAKDNARDKILKGRDFGVCSNWNKHHLEWHKHNTALDSAPTIRSES